MTERPFIWHESKFAVTHTSHPWTVTLGRPTHVNDFETGHSAPTLEAAMEIAISLVPREVP